MIKTKRQMRIIIGSISALMVVVIAGIVYSAFTGQLNINGQGIVRNSSWDIHIVETGELEPTKKASDSVVVLHKPTASGTSISDYSVSLTTPGDSISYTFNVINEGDYNAKISSVNIPTPECTETDVNDTISGSKVCSKLSYTLKYASGASVSANDMLLSKETKTMILTLTYQDFSDASLLPTSDVAISNLGITINYEQADDAIVNESDGTTPKEYETYSVGDVVTLNNEEYYVLDEDSTSRSYVTLLKANPLTVAEVNEYGVGHINRYTSESVGTAYNLNGYGGMAYYSSETCGYVNGSWVEAGCPNNYNSSEVKYAVDGWARSKFTNGELATDANGYQARLITFEEVHSLGYGDEPQEPCGLSCGVLYYPKTDAVPEWLYNDSYWYWTMSHYNNSSAAVWYVNFTGTVSNSNSVHSYSAVVRPVINVYKSRL